MSSQSPPRSVPRLPNEIILDIMESLIPTGHKAIAIPASDPITKTLLALVRTSSITRPTALRLLYTHCLYIDSSRRLDGLTKALRLSLKYEEGQAIQEKQPQRKIFKRTRFSLRSNNAQRQELSLVQVHKYATSLYLVPVQKKSKKSPKKTCK